MDKFIRKLNFDFITNQRIIQLISYIDSFKGKWNIVENKELFMSPELYKRLLGKDKTAKYDPYQNDLYGLGLSLLSAGNGDKLTNLYLPNGEFNQKALGEYLDKFDAKYANNSPQLSQFVHYFLHILILQYMH